MVKNDQSGQKWSKIVKISINGKYMAKMIKNDQKGKKWSEMIKNGKSDKKMGRNGKLTSSSHVPQ